MTTAMRRRRAGAARRSWFARLLREAAVVARSPALSPSAEPPSALRFGQTEDMCGRVTLTTPAELVGEMLADVDWNVADHRPRYNITPQQHLPILLLEDGRRVARSMRWGLRRYWWRDPKAKQPTNARSETIATTPMFRDLVARRRCVAITDGYFEWRGEPGSKQPFHFRDRAGGLLLMAGLWDEWRDADGSALTTFAIATTTPNAAASAIHDRMPVILNRDGVDAWIDVTTTPTAQALDLLRPYTGELVIAPVSRLVNQVRHDSPEVIRPVEIEQPRLL